MPTGKCWQLTYVSSVNNIDDEHVSGADGPGLVSDDHIEVLTANNNKGKRVRDKIYRCLYCSMEVAQLPHHLYSARADETDVQELPATKDLHKRRLLLAKLRHIGDHQQNLKTLNQGKGSIRVAYRPSKGSSVVTDSSKYVPCQYCFGYYCRRQLWRHVHRCPVALASNENCHQNKKRMFALLQLLEPSVYCKHARKLTHCQDIKNSLSPLEQHLCEFYTRVEIPGKRNNCVPVLMTDDQTHALSFITNAEYRQRAGIHNSNTFEFALGRGSLSHTRGHDVLRNFSSCCDAENPENLRSSRLRKHIATTSQMLNLKNHVLDQVAQILGHDVRVHYEGIKKILSAAPCSHIAIL